MQSCFPVVIGRTSSWPIEAYSDVGTCKIYSVSCGIIADFGLVQAKAVRETIRLNPNNNKNGIEDPHRSVAVS
jgi:hypothetical protein